MAIASLVLLVHGFAVSATHDYLAWNRARWHALDTGRYPFSRWMPFGRGRILVLQGVGSKCPNQQATTRLMGEGLLRRTDRRDMRTLERVERGSGRRGSSFRPAYLPYGRHLP